MCDNAARSIAGSSRRRRRGEARSRADAGRTPASTCFLPRPRAANPLAGGTRLTEQLVCFVARSGRGLLRALELRPHLLDQQVDSSLAFIVIAIHGRDPILAPRRFERCEENVYRLKRRGGDDHYRTSRRSCTMTDSHVARSSKDGLSLVVYR